MTSISAYGIDRVKHFNELTSSEPLIRDLEEIVKKRALYLYKEDAENRKDSIRSFFQKEEPYMDFNWDGVLISPEKSKCKEIIAGVDVVRASSNTVLVNRSKINQQHKLTAERQTSSVCESSLYKGFTIGSTVGLSLKPPATMKNLPNSEIEITTAFSLQHKQDSKSEEKDSWSVEDFVIVPQKSTITVCRQLNENEKEYSFTTRIGVSGKVRVTCYNRKKEITTVYMIPMITIITEEFEKEMVEVKDNIVYITVSGRCTLRKRMDEIIITP